jgi:hypothetical protein
MRPQTSVLHGFWSFLAKMVTFTNSSERLLTCNLSDAEQLDLARIIHDPLRLVDFPPPFSAEANS